MLTLVFIFKLNAAQECEFDNVKKFEIINNTNHDISLIVGPVEEQVNDSAVTPSDMLAGFILAHKSKSIVLQKHISHGAAKAHRAGHKYTRFFNTAKYFKVGVKKGFWEPFDDLTSSNNENIEENAIYQVNIGLHSKLKVTKIQGGNSQNSQSPKNVPPGGVWVD